jgi:hypothetical protein
VIGSGVGGLVVGILLGLLGTYLVMKRSFKKKLEESRFVEVHSSPGSPNALAFDHSSGPSQYRPLPTTLSPGAVGHSMQQMTNSPTMHHRMGPGEGYQVEPFVMPDMQGHIGAASQARPTSAYNSSASGRITSVHDSTTSPRPVGHGQVYVLHHDSNVPPVTIYHQEGAQIVELPPRYPPMNAPQSDALSEGRSISDGRSAGNETTFSDQSRKPNQVRKPTQDHSYQ